MYCKECGEQITNDSKFCPNCGNKQIDEPKYTESRGQVLDVHQCPHCDSFLAPILNSKGKQFGSVCLKCDPYIKNNTCPVCHKTLQIYYGKDNCKSCGYSWRLQDIRNNGMFSAFPEPVSKVQETKESEPLKCPRCHSTDLTGNKKGYRVGNALVGVVLTGGIGLLGGFFGSNKIKITCMRCGYTWGVG